MCRDGGQMSFDNRASDLGITSARRWRLFLRCDCQAEKGPAMKTFGNRPRERGDVPGWVLITLMTAGLVIVIWAAAGPALAGVFEQAISRVTSF